MENNSAIDIKRIRLDEILARVAANDAIGGETHFIIGIYGATIMIGGEAAKDTFAGDLYFDKNSLATLVEMISDALAGKLQTPETSRFDFDQGYFMARTGDDHFIVGIRTVWTNPQRDEPTQLIVQNAREYKYGELGAQTGMQIAMSVPTARKFLAALEKIRL